MSTLILGDIILSGDALEDLRLCDHTMNGPCESVQFLTMSAWTTVHRHDVLKNAFITVLMLYVMSCQAPSDYWSAFCPSVMGILQTVQRRLGRKFICHRACVAKLIQTAQSVLHYIRRGTALMCSWAGGFRTPCNHFCLAQSCKSRFLQQCCDCHIPKHVATRVWDLLLEGLRFSKIGDQKRARKTFRRLANTLTEYLETPRESPCLLWTGAAAKQVCDAMPGTSMHMTAAGRLFQHVNFASLPILADVGDESRWRIVVPLWDALSHKFVKTALIAPSRQFVAVMASSGRSSAFRRVELAALEAASVAPQYWTVAEPREVLTLANADRLLQHWSNS